MNVEIGAQAALFPEKEYISGISVAVWDTYASNFRQNGPLSVLIIFRIFWYLSSELTCKRDGTVGLVCSEPLEGEQHLDEHPHHHQHHLVAQVQE
jgi:hypothetical protein